MPTYTGTVQKGKRRGHELGYPTINLPLTDADLSGVFAARVYIGDEAPYMAAAFADPSRGMLEAHLLDFSDDLYGLDVKIELHKKVREGRKFSGDDEARRVIAEDVHTVREYFRS